MRFACFQVISSFSLSSARPLEKTSEEHLLVMSFGFSFSRFSDTLQGFLFGYRVLQESFFFSLDLGLFVIMPVGGRERVIVPHILLCILFPNSIDSQLSWLSLTFTDFVQERKDLSFRPGESSWWQMGEIKYPNGESLRRDLNLAIHSIY